MQKINIVKRAHTEKELSFFFQISGPVFERQPLLMVSYVPRDPTAALFVVRKKLKVSEVPTGSALAKEITAHPYSGRLYRHHKERIHFTRA